MNRRHFGWTMAGGLAAANGLRIEIERITSGPKHHFFGYIGHVRNIPWNSAGRYIVALRTAYQDHMPAPGEPAEVVLLDTANGYRVDVIERSRAWNFQQGTMFYWNPKSPETQLFFNDRDPKTHRVFAVLFDVRRGKRLREYRFDDTPVGNSGVAQNGGAFAAINYGRLARLRPVTGYPGAFDWNAAESAPANDGVFHVDVESGRKRLIVSFRQMVERLRAQSPSIATRPLFINHTLWSRDDSRIYFYVRGDFAAPSEQRTNIPCTVRPDGSRLEPLALFIGGHPEWETGSRIIGSADGRQVIYDTDQRKVVETLGTPEILPDPGADVALSPDGNWLVNGYRKGHENFYVVMHRRDGRWARSRGFAHAGYTSGDLRVDGSPCWNRSSDGFLFPALAEDGTRQLYLARIRS